MWIWGPSRDMRAGLHRFLRVVFTASAPAADLWVNNQREWRLCNLCTSLATAPGSVLCQKTALLYQQPWKTASRRPHLLPRIDGDWICEQQSDLAIKTSEGLSPVWESTVWQCRLILLGSYKHSTEDSSFQLTAHIVLMFTLLPRNSTRWRLWYVFESIRGTVEEELRFRTIYCLSI